VLVAEKLENQAEFDLARGEGFAYFQGYFFCRPKILADREIPANQLNYLRLLTELTRTPFRLREVTRIVESEASLCYRLLRLANSALVGVRKEVTGVREAVVLVGEARFRTLVAVALSTAMGKDQPMALIRLSLERARFCEQLADRIGADSTEQYMLGLLSLLDAILETPMEKIVASLPLRQEARAALLGEESAAGAALRLIKSIETGTWAACGEAAQSLGLSEEMLAGRYMESMQWAANAIAASN
jgi:c-di-GMP-related signal transduction protein